MSKPRAYFPDSGRAILARDMYDDTRESLLEKVDEPKFHIGQVYTDGPAKALRCLVCGGNKFYVGRDEWYTAVKCVTCEWELCIHDG